MARSQALRAPEFRRRLVELVRLGCRPEDLAEEFETPAREIRAWVRWQARGAAIRRRNERISRPERPRA